MSAAIFLELSGLIYIPTSMAVRLRSPSRRQER